MASKYETILIVWDLRDGIGMSHAVGIPHAALPRAAISYQSIVTVTWTIENNCINFYDWQQVLPNESSLCRPAKAAENKDEINDSRRACYPAISDIGLTDYETFVVVAKW